MFESLSDFLTTRISTEPEALLPLADSNLLAQLPPSGSTSRSEPPSTDPLDSYWTKHYSSSLTTKGKDDSLPSTADIVVIGSGLTAICAVDRLVEEWGKKSSDLKQDKIRVVVAEARDFCSGATARNGGHLTSSPLLSYDTLTKLFGPDEARRCVALEQESIDYIIKTCRDEGWVEDVELRIGNGNLHLFDTEEQRRHVQLQLDSAARAGEDLTGHEWLNEEQVLERYQATSKAGGLLIPGNNVYPLKFVTKLFLRALERCSQPDSNVSLELFTHCLVSSVARSGGGSNDWIVKTARGDIAARHVLHCTNGYLSSVLPTFATGPSRIVQTRGQVVSIVPHPPPRPITSSKLSTSSSPVDSNQQSTPTTPTTNRRRKPKKPTNWPHWTNSFLAEEPYDIYMNPSSSSHFSRGGRGSNIILGGCRDASGVEEDFEYGKSNDSEGSVNVKVGRQLREYLKWQFPTVLPGDSNEGQESEGEGLEEKQEKSFVPSEDWNVEMEWTGIMGFREGGIPIVGPLWIDGELQQGQWVSAGYSGHGMPRAPLSGQLLGSLVVHSILARQSTNSSLDNDALPFELPKSFPRHYLTTRDGQPDTNAKVPGERGWKFEHDEEECSEWVWVD